MIDPETMGTLERQIKNDLASLMLKDTFDRTYAAEMLIYRVLTGIQERYMVVLRTQFDRLETMCLDLSTQVQQLQADLLAYQQKQNTPFADLHRALRDFQTKPGSGGLTATG